MRGLHGLFLHLSSLSRVRIGRSAYINVYLCRHIHRVKTVPSGGRIIGNCRSCHARFHKPSGLSTS